MTTGADTLSGLYYPFSRCINSSSLKQLLLVFDSLVFLDPVEDEAWRAKLLRDQEDAEDARFKNYRGIFESLPTLIDEGAIRRASPLDSSAIINAPSTAAASISDLLDPGWTRVASAPDRYQMPHMHLGRSGAPTWQAFLPKLPSAFVTTLQKNKRLRPHLISEAGEDEAWILSYAAGSAASLNVHLAVAEELGLAPVTDSEMHNELLLLKLIRSQADNKKEQPITQAIAHQLARKVAISILEDILPQRELAKISFDQILDFRARTRLIRYHLLTGIAEKVTLLTRVPDTEQLHHAAREVKQGLESELRTYRAEFTNTRDKLWPALVGSANSTLATGSIAAVGMSFIGGPGYALAASIVTASLAVLKATLDISAERNKLKNSAAPAVTYLSRVATELN
jgi:hypothetical protein